MTKWGSYFPSDWSAQTQWPLAVKGRGELSPSQRYFSLGKPHSRLLDPKFVSSLIADFQAFHPSHTLTNHPIQVLVLSPRQFTPEQGAWPCWCRSPEDVRKDISGGNCKAASQRGLWSHLESGAEGNLTTSPIHRSKCSADQSQGDNNTF